MLRDAHPAILETVRQAESIHILGAGMNAERPAHRAIHDLDEKGWRLVPIHPNDAGGSILGRPIRSSIDHNVRPEIIVFFLAPLRVREVVRELVMHYPADAMPLLWFQPGAEDEETLEMLNDAGVLHIVDDCIVRFVQRHHLAAVNGQSPQPWYLQVASADQSGCSVWTVESAQETQRPPSTDVEWCGDLKDLEHSEHVVPRYIRGLKQDGESLAALAQRLAV